MILALMVLGVFVLVRASGILIPLAVGLLFWFFLNALAQIYGLAWSKAFGTQPYRFFTIGFALLTMVAASIVAAQIIVVNVGQIGARTADFEQSIDILVAKVAELTGIPHEQLIDRLFGSLNIQRLIGSIVAGVTSLASYIGVVFIYVVFLLVEQRFFNTKLDIVVKDPARRQTIRSILERVGRDIQSYLWTMSIVSMMTAILSYVVMTLVGLDNAAFWAFLIFILNFIPTIGSILGTAIPALYALLQFADLSVFATLVVALGIIQFVIGNIVQPRMTARSLNLSQFVVIVALFAWGAIWGIIGMFLAVPLTAIALIIFAYFPQTRGIAMMLSESGDLSTVGAGATDSSDGLPKTSA